MRKEGISFIFFAIILSFLVSAGVFSDVSQSNFSSGTFANTFYNTSGFVQLNYSIVSGNFTSRVFDAGGNSSWNFINWTAGLCYGCALPNGGVSEKGYATNANMSGNVLLLHLDESPGTSYADSSGLGNNALCVGSRCPTTSAQGIFGNSPHFDGNTGSGGDMLNLSNPSSLNNFGDSITIEVWANMTDFNSPSGNFPTLVDKDPGQQFSLYFTKIVTTQGRSHVDLRNGSTIASLDGTTTLFSRTWNHIVFTYNGSEMRLYSNGVLDSSSNALSGAIATSSKDLLVGGGWSGNSITYFADALIDEVAIYNRSLSAAEIQQHYTRGVARLNVSVRSCPTSSCAGVPFTQVNSTSSQNLSLNGQYFQYLTKFSTGDTGFPSQFHNATVGYDLLNTAPVVNITFPVNSTNYSLSALSLNYTVIKPQNNLDKCWYSTNNGVTNSSPVSCGTNFSGVVASQGTNVWRVYANDTLGFQNFSSVSFYVDSQAPSISIVAPQNNSILGSKNVAVNYTVSDANLRSCWYSTNNGVTNISLTCGQNISYTASEGLNGVYVYANDSFGNSNLSSVSFVVDSTPPSFSSYKENPANGSVYSSGRFYEFNVSVSDQHIGTVNGNWSGTSYATYGSYAFNVSDLGAGTYQYNWYANDTLGNVNGSDARYYTVAKAVPHGLLTNFTSLTVVYPSAISIGYSESNGGDSDVQYNVYRDGVSIGSGENLTLSVGTYTYTLNASSGANYTSNSSMDSFVVNVVQASGAVSLLLNNSASNITILQGDSIYLNASLINGTGFLQLYVNGLLVNNGTSPISNLTTFNILGLFNVTASYSGDGNYSSASSILYVHVIDTEFPNVSIVYPLNTSYNLVQTELNYTVFDQNLQSCWYSTNLGVTNFTVSCGSNVTTSSSQGTNVWRVYANDSSGNIGFGSVTFYVDSQAPSISISKPVGTYGQNSSIPLSYSVHDSGIGVQSCWYSWMDVNNMTINSSGNVALPACQNTTFSVPTVPGNKSNYVVFVSANDSFGNLGSENVSFSINLDAPAIQIISPSDNIYVNESNISFVYNVTGVQIQYCSLLADFNGTFVENQTNNSISSGQIGQFSVNLSEGTYSWAISCNDSQNNSGYAGNYNLAIDKTAPTSQIYQPLGNYTFSSTSITLPLNFSVNDTSPVTCDYEIAFPSLICRDAPCILSTGSVDSCISGNNNITFPLTPIGSNGDYLVYLTVADAAGNSVMVNSSFGVQITQSSGGGSNGNTNNPGPTSGGGGGGGLTGVSGFIKLNLSAVSPLSVKKGQSQGVVIEAFNQGTRFLNLCRLSAEGILEDWVANSQIESLGSGQRVNYIFDISVPRSATTGQYSSSVLVSCNETDARTPLVVNVLPSDFDFNFLNSTRDANILRARYSLEEFTGSNQQISVTYSLDNSDGVSIAEGQQLVVLGAGNKQEYDLSIPLPKDSIGEFTLVMEFSNGRDSFKVGQGVLLSSVGVTGLAISETNRQTLVTASFFVFGLLILYLLIHFLYKHYKRISRTPGALRHHIRVHLRRR